MGIEGMMNGFSANKKELLGAAAAALVAGTAGGAEAQAVEHRQYSATEIEALVKKAQNGDWLHPQERIALSGAGIQVDTDRVIRGLSNVVRIPEAKPEAKEQIQPPYYGNVRRSVKVNGSYTSGPGASNNVGKIDGK